MIHFNNSYNATLVRTCYAKFMAIPSYVYLKLKMPGPRGAIMVSGSFLTTYECDRVVVDHANNFIAHEEFKHLKDDRV